MKRILILALLALATTTTAFGQNASCIELHHLQQNVCDVRHDGRHAYTALDLTNASATIQTITAKEYRTRLKIEQDAALEETARLEAKVKKQAADNCKSLREQFGKDKNFDRDFPDCRVQDAK